MDQVKVFYDGKMDQNKLVLTNPPPPTWFTFVLQFYYKLNDQSNLPL